MLFQRQQSPNCWEIDVAKLCIWRINAGDMALPCFRNTSSNTASAFLSSASPSPWVVNESTHGGFVVAFHTLAPAVSYGLCFVAVNHLLSASAMCQRGDEHQHSPPLQFLSCCRFYLGRSPGAAACLPTPPLLSLALACYVSIFGSDDTYSYNSFQCWSAGIRSDTRAFRRSSAPGYQGLTNWTVMVVLAQNRCSVNGVKQVGCKNHPLICDWFVRQDICKSLWCHRTGHRCETKFMPAAEGTTCGPDMVRKCLLRSGKWIFFHCCFGQCALIWMFVL